MNHRTWRRDEGGSVVCGGWGWWWWWWRVVNSRLLMSIITAINTVGRRGKQRLDVDFDLIAVSQSCNQTRSEIAKLEQTEYKFLLTSTSMNGSLRCHPCRNVFFSPRWSPSRTAQQDVITSLFSTFRMINMSSDE